MIDPLTSLSFAVYSNKGAYALLLGSGVSRSSGIPTGWEVVLDLIRKVSALEGGDCEPDPAEWFRGKNKTEPDYSQLLDGIAKTSTERQQLLRGYFEPTDDEREQGLKLPTSAHRAIARLVASGHVRVILTTNFDRLTEMALGDVGISPTVISTADQIAGSLPLVHSPVTVIKLHGDYLDTRIRNTESELTCYDTALDELLDRVLDEYGLIVSGWSGDWDIALRAAIERCPSRRFTTFWATRSPLSEKADSLAKHRQAQIVQSKDADQFFAAIEEKVHALEDLAAPHPLSAKIAVATVKRYLVDPSAKIRLYDLVNDEVTKLVLELDDPIFQPNPSLRIETEIPMRVERYESLCDVTLSILVTSCFWAAPNLTDRWVSVLQRISDTGRIHGGSQTLINLRYYPVLLMLYGASLALVATGNYATLGALLIEPKARNDQGRLKELCVVVYPDAVLDRRNGHLIPESGRNGLSERLYAKLREPLRAIIPRDDDYRDAFVRFEYLFGLVVADKLRWRRQNTGGWWGPVGCSYEKDIHQSEDRQIAHRIQREMDMDGVNWGFLASGLFGGSIEQAKAAKLEFDAFLEDV